MPDILLEATIAVSPDKVFTALTEGEALEGWWATQAVAEPKVGSTVEARFGDDAYVHKFEVIDLEPKRRVDWICRDSLPEWNGTHMTWELSTAEAGTKILFGHRGWASADGMLPMCSYHWAIYLNSLKHYAETGKGNPYPFVD